MEFMSLGVCAIITFNIIAAIYIHDSIRVFYDWRTIVAYSTQHVLLFPVGFMQNLFVLFVGYPTHSTGKIYKCHKCSKRHYVDGVTCKCDRCHMKHVIIGEK